MNFTCKPNGVYVSQLGLCVCDRLVAGLNLIVSKVMTLQLGPGTRPLASCKMLTLHSDHKLHSHLSMCH